MLKGFIDLVFRHEGRYYLLVTTNWLGEDREAYTRPAMEQGDACPPLRSTVSAV